MTRDYLILSARVGGGDDASDPRAAVAIASLAESAKLDLLILGDDAAAAGTGFDPLILASWLASRLPNVGVVPRVAALASEPFHVARALSALDYMTGGRSGWLPSSGGDAAGLAKAEDFVAATRSLWRSWDGDALIIDQASGVYLDSAKVRPNDYRGPFFTAFGPLNAARPPQGEPLLVQSDHDPLWRQLPADVLIADEGTVDDGGPLRLLRRDSTSFDRATIDTVERMFRSESIGGLHFDTIDALKSFAASALPELLRRGLIDDSDRSVPLRIRLGLRVADALATA